ncbi:MAG: phosphodiester glycosidase family protein [Patescibacteria group bacterium]
MKRFFLTIFVVLCLFLLFIIGNDVIRTHQITENLDTSPIAPFVQPSKSIQLSQDWQTLSSGVEVRSLQYAYNGQSYQIQVIRLDPNQGTLSLQYDQRGKTVSQWAKGTDHLVVSNAGFFKEKNEPVGLLYVNGERLDSHRVKPADSGLLVIHENGIEILNLANAPIPAELQNAVQTYPVLIDQGKLIANKNMTKQDRRTAIGTDRDRRIYLFTAGYQHLGLYDFAKVISESGLQLTEVLNLDGGGSTGVAVDAGTFQKIIESETAVPTVLVFSERK